MSVSFTKCVRSTEGGGRGGCASLVGLLILIAVVGMMAPMTPESNRNAPAERVQQIK